MFVRHGLTQAPTDDTDRRRLVSDKKTMKKNEKINIVIFNMSAFSEWERGIQNRNFHILKNLRANGKIGKIVAIDYLPHNFKRNTKNT